EPRPPVVSAARRLSGHTDAIAGISLSADGRLVLSGSKDGTMRLWDLAAEREEVRVLLGQGQEVRSVALAPDGKLAVSAAGATIRLWDVPSGRELARLSGHSATVTS